MTCRSGASAEIHSVAAELKAGVLAVQHQGPPRPSSLHGRRCQYDADIERTQKMKFPSCGCDESRILVVFRIGWRAGTGQCCTLVLRPPTPNEFSRLLKLSAVLPNYGMKCGASENSLGGGRKLQVAHRYRACMLILPPPNPDQFSSLLRTST